MTLVSSFMNVIPEVKGPLQKLGFKDKLIWTLIVLIAFFVLSVLPLYGLGQNSLQQFEQLSILLGASFGSILSLGIGPIVTSSIVLQLLVGSGILKIDIHTQEGKSYFQGLQKILTLFFVLFEAAIYVFLGGLAPNPNLPPSSFFSFQLILVAQLIIGGVLILYMDEIVSKWGFGSGVSLFIAAGVSAEIFVRAFSPLTSTGVLAFGSGQPPVGAVLVFFISLVKGDPTSAIVALSAILATVIIFVLSVYAQAMKVEIPLTFGRVRGYGMRWPLNFLYTSNIPVILVAALIANVQLFARLLESWGRPILGTFVGGSPASGLIVWLNPPNLINNLITGAFKFSDLSHGFVYILFLTAGAVIFSIFWVQTSGMDSESQAKQIMSSGLQVPGFRRDPRVIQSLLERYIFPLTIMGGFTIGILAGGADLLGALSRGTGILLAVMIIYRLYEDISKQHMMDMHPALRKMMGGE